MNEPTLPDLIDACRADRDDLAAEEMRTLREQLADDEALQANFNRSQQFDRLLRAAFSDVAVPAELEVRLLERLQQDAVLASPAGSHFTVRRIGLALAALAATIAIVLGISQIVSSRPVFASEVQLVEAAMRWSDRLSGAGWNDAPLSPDPRPSTSQLAVPLGRWQRLEEAGVGLICYELADRTVPQGRARGYLFVLPARVARVNQNQPPRRAFSTQGRQVAAWRDGKYVYVLVLDGTEEEYRRITHQGQSVASVTAPPLTARRSDAAFPNCANFSTCNVRIDKRGLTLVS